MTAGTSPRRSGPNAERRSGTDRRLGERRAGPDRRRRSRRTSSAAVELDMRLGRDRRAGQRRGEFDRRSRVGRRMADRREGALPPFDTDDVARLRIMVRTDPRTVVCPICFRPLTPEPASPEAGAGIWEVRCIPCNRAAMLTGNAPATILLIEHESVVRDAISLVLQRAGHRVLEVSTDEGALEAVVRHAPDLAVLDLQVPGLDGLGLMRRLLRERPSLRVVAVAGRRRIGAPDVLAAAKRLGAVEILRKPFPPPVVLGLVEGAGSL